MKNKALILIPLLMLIAFISFSYKSNPDANTPADRIALQKGQPIATMSYTTLTSTIYQAEARNFSKLDIATMTPINEKQHIDMKLFENGEMELSVQELTHPNKIDLKHKTLPNDVPDIMKTETKDGMIKFYDKDNRLIHSQEFELPNQIEMVNKLKSIGKDYSPEMMKNMTESQYGKLFMDNLNELLKNPSKEGVKVTSQNEKFVTLRKPTGERGQESVTLVNKEKKRVVGSRIYQDNELVMSMYYGYDSKTSRVNATKQLMKVALPSGSEVNQEVNTIITDYQFDINLK